MTNEDQVSAEKCPEDAGLVSVQERKSPADEAINSEARSYKFVVYIRFFFFVADSVWVIQCVLANLTCLVRLQRGQPHTQITLGERELGKHDCWSV
jgi:hypothetical protein